MEPVKALRPKASPGPSATQSRRFGGSVADIHNPSSSVRALPACFLKQTHPLMTETLSERMQPASNMKFWETSRPRPLGKQCILEYRDSNSNSGFYTRGRVPRLGNAAEAEHLLAFVMGMQLGASPQPKPSSLSPCKS